MSVRLGVIIILIRFKYASVRAYFHLLSQQIPQHPHVIYAKCNLWKQFDFDYFYTCILQTRSRWLVRFLDTSLGHTGPFAFVREQLTAT